MNEGPYIDSDLLARYVSGEADAQQRAAVEQWADAASDNASELRRMRALWDLGAEGIAAPDLDVDRAWSRLNARMAAADGRGRVVPMRAGSTAMRWLAAAAVVAGLVLGVRYLFNNEPLELMAATDHVRSTLSDSSSVILSPGSRLSARMKNERHIALSGEAYFEVKRDEKRPFVVETEDVTVTVLGTGFEVSAYDTSNSVLVRVRHGKVRVVAAGDSVVLVAGGYARYNRTAHILERLAAPPAEVWGDRIIQFEQAPMAQVVQQLQRIFNVRLALANPALENCLLTASFEDEPIDYILRVIADTYGLKLTEEAPGRYVLDGDGC